MKDMENAINQLCHFLAVRDFNCLNKAELKDKTGAEKVDVLMVFGNELLHVIETAIQAMQDGLAEHLLFCGGIGHGTSLLRRNVIAGGGYGLSASRINRLSEAEIAREIAAGYGGISSENILVETTSTNCGENSQNGVRLLKENGVSMKRIILMQDPLMQRRSYATLQRCIPEGCNVFNYASFIPAVDSELHYLGEMPPAWDTDRFYALILGEISRLRDDDKGYGPNGMNFIDHVEIPEDVEAAYQIVMQHRPGDGSRVL